MLRYEKNSDGSERWSTDRGSITLLRPAPTIMVWVYDGHVDTPAYADAIMQATEPAMAAGLKPIQFIDLEKLTSYDSTFRVKIAEWGKKNKDRLGKLYIYYKTESKLVGMAVYVINLALGGAYHIMRTRREFDATLARCIAEAQRGTTTSPTGL